MTERDSEKFEKVQSKIEKEISPYITVKISMPEGVDKEAFLRLEKDEAFIESLKKRAKDWLIGK
jgi:hypothetical protein